MIELVMMDSQGQFLTCSLENIPTKILKNPIIPISGAITPVLGIKKPSPLTITLNIGYNIFRHQVQVHRFSEWRVPYGN